MKLSRRRVWAIVRKELREYRHNRSLIVGMAILPLVFIIQPLIAVLGLSAAASSPLGDEHVLVYMLGIPILVPVIVAASAVAGERQQGTLEPALTTPIRGDEFLLGKALAALLPSLAIAYVVFAVFLVLVALFAQQGIASALIRGPDLLAQVLFTPLLAAWSIWVGIAVSTRSSDAASRAADRPPGEPAAGLRGGAHRAQRDPSDARPRARRCRSPARARCSRLAGHLAAVRP